MWSTIHAAVQAKGTDFFSVRHVNSHLGSAGITAGRISAEDEYANRQADSLATAGAASHAVCPELRAQALHRCQLAECLQRLAVRCMEARHKAAPAPTRRIGYTDAALARFADVGMDCIPSARDLSQLEAMPADPFTDFVPDYIDNFDEEEELDPFDLGPESFSA